MNFVPIIYDVLAAVIVIHCIKKGADDGFAKTAIKTVGYVCSAIAALVISNIAAAIVYSVIIEPEIIGRIESAISGAVDAESVLDRITSAVESLPAVSGLFFDLSGVSGELSQSVNLDYTEIAKNVSEMVTEPVLVPIIRTLFFAFSLIILFFAVSLIAKGSKVVNDVPVIGEANGFFGGVFGILNGILMLCLAAVILDMVIGNGAFPEYFSENIISETFLFRYIYFPVTGYID